MHVRPLMAGGQRAATVLLSSSQCPAQVHSDHLQPAISLSYERHAIDSNSGNVHGADCASQPFGTRRSRAVSLPSHPGPAALARTRLDDAGCELHPAAAPLRPRPGRRPGTRQSSVHCCNISLLFNASEGGRVEFDAGSWHSIAHLPDLRLTCVAGAGNFPSERLPLVVAAATLTGFLAQLMVMGEVPQDLSGGLKSPFLIGGLRGCG